jgi:hypothetical protein
MPPFHKTAHDEPEAEEAAGEEVEDYLALIFRS